MRVHRIEFRALLLFISLFAAWSTTYACEIRCVSDAVARCRCYRLPHEVCWTLRWHRAANTFHQWWPCDVPKIESPSMQGSAMRCCQGCIARNGLHELIKSFLREHSIASPSLEEGRRNRLQTASAIVGFEQVATITFCVPSHLSLPNSFPAICLWMGTIIIQYGRSLSTSTRRWRPHGFATRAPAAADEWVDKWDTIKALIESIALFFWLFMCVRALTQQFDPVWCLTGSPTTQTLSLWIERNHVWQSSVIMSLIKSLKCLCRNEWNA